MLAISLTLAPASLAQERLPDYSAIDQYFESLPAADGPRPIRPEADGSGGAGGSLSQRLAVAGAGPVLRRVASDPRLGPSRTSRSARNPGSRDASRASAERNLLVAVQRGFFSSEGPGPLLVIAGVTILLAALALRRVATARS